MKAFITEYQGRRVSARRLNEGRWPYVYMLRDFLTDKRTRITSTTHLPHDPDEATGK